MKRILFLLSAFILTINCIQAQHTAAGPHDFGRMWTFENPPKAWLTKAYNFTPSDSWFDDVRKSALRMSTGCSASFVSPNGLIMTNHHCSRDAALGAQKEGEDIMTNGYFARTLDDERKVPNVFFEQLVVLADITGEVNNYVNNSNKKDIESKLSEALEKVKSDYAKLEAWKDLRLQIVKYYSGVKYSIYGYKKYSDIRLVAIPETDIAFYGGDADNFTYPRYDVDFTFWRAYDEDGKPVNSSANYFKFNPKGAAEGDLVFVIGNPGNTERYRTVDQLKWDRKYRYPMTLDFLRQMIAHLQEDYDKNPTDEKMNMIFGMANGEKAYSGILKGLKNPELFNRKVEIENLVRKNHKGEDYWAELKAEYDKLAPHSWAIILLSPNPMRGNTMMLMHSIAKYDEKLHAGVSEDDLEDIVDQIDYLTKNIGDKEDKFYLTMGLKLINSHIPSDNNTMKELFKGKSAEEYVEKLMSKSKFFKGDKWKKYFKMDSSKFDKQKDMLLVAAKKLIPQYNAAAKAFADSSAKRKELEGKIVQEYFKYFGTDLPPDATFTLRISDGVVKGYDYNGTKAPYKTTFYGMYDRNYSFDHNYPWRLPERYKYPSPELLKQPLDFVSTNDIIGGNSGSAIINQNKEVVGLIFDGNIESLPGNFIYDEKYNRAVSVHAGGILAALKYVYHAGRLLEELVPAE